MLCMPPPPPCSAPVLIFRKPCTRAWLSCLCCWGQHANTWHPAGPWHLPSLLCYRHVSGEMSNPVFSHIAKKKEKLVLYHLAFWDEFHFLLCIIFFPERSTGHLVVQQRAPETLVDYQTYLHWILHWNIFKESKPEQDGVFCLMQNCAAHGTDVYW